MAKKKDGPKAGDKKTDKNGMSWTRTKGGNWRDSNGNLWNNGKGGDPDFSTSGSAGSTGMNSGTYLEALDSLSGGRLAQGKQELQDQVAKGWITQGQADAEYNRVRNEVGSGKLAMGLKDIAGGDAAIEKGFMGGAELGSALFSPGSLGRVDETASADQLAIQDRLKSLSEPNVDPLLQSSLDRANATADAAQTLDPELQNVLNIRKAALGGLSTEELLATKEMAQSSLNQSLTSAVRALRIGQGGTGPRGAAANIGAMPLTAQYANSQADLSRKLILDQYKAQADARDAYSGDAQKIITGFQDNRIKANDAAQNAATTAINDRTSRFNNYISYNTNLRNDLYGRQLQNLNSMAAEKSGAIAAIFGGGSFASQQQGRQQTFELGKMNLDLQKEIFKSNQGGSGGGGGEGTTSPGGGDEDTFG